MFSSLPLLFYTPYILFVIFKKLFNTLKYILRYLIKKIDAILTFKYPSLLSFCQEVLKKMKQKRKSFRKDKRGFTGLEAAIVLTAFIVVAAVFAYVVLNAGFFTTEKAKQVVHTGVGMATSSCTLSGDVIGKGNTSGAETVDYIVATIQLTAGHNPIRISDNSSENQTDQWFVVSYRDELVYTNSTEWTRSWVGDSDEDNVLEYGEKAEITITVPTSSMLNTATEATNAEFTMEFKPAEGAVMTFTKETPPTIDAVMVMY